MKTAILIIFLLFINTSFEYSENAVKKHHNSKLAISNSLRLIENPIKDIITHMKNSVNDIISHAGHEARSVIYDAAVKLESTIYNVEIAYEGQLDNTLDKLDSYQRQTIIDLRNAVNELEKGIEPSVTTIDRIQSDWQVILSNLPFSKKIPYVTDYGPNFIIRSDCNLESELITIWIHGQNLDTHGVPYLLFPDNSKIEPSSTTFGDIEFVINKNKLPFDDKTLKNLEFKLVMYTYKPWWKLLAVNTKIRPIRTNLLPDIIGTMEITTVTKEEVVETKSFTTKPAYSNTLRDHGYDKVRWDASEGYLFDLNSLEKIIKPNHAWRNGKSDKKPHNNRFDYITLNKKFIEFQVRSSPLAKNERAEIKAYVKGIEYRKRNIENPDIKLYDGEVKWCESQVIKLPPNHVSWTATLTFPNGSKRILHDQDLENEWVSIEYNGRGNELIIVPEF